MLVIQTLCTPFGEFMISSIYLLYTLENWSVLGLCLGLFVCINLTVLSRIYYFIDGSLSPPPPPNSQKAHFHIVFDYEQIGGYLIPCYTYACSARTSSCPEILVPMTPPPSPK